MDKAGNFIRTAKAGAAAWSAWSVAVTGIDGEPGSSGLAVARCLRETQGFRGRVLAFGLGSAASDAGPDRYWDARVSVPEPVAGASVLLDRIDEIRREAPIDAVIPCRDTELPNYITLRPALAQRGIRLMLPDRATLYSRNKDYLPTLCAKAEIATPRVRRITHEGFFDLKGVDSEFWRYPMVVKGIFYDAYVVHTPEEAKRRFHQVAASWGYPVLVQEFVDGEECALAGLGDGAGAMVDAAMLKKRGSVGLAIDDPELLAAGRRLMANLKWRGPLEIEMLRDKAGKLHLIEINPRLPSWIGFPAGSGTNLTAALLAMMADGMHEYPELMPASWWNREPAAIRIEGIRGMAGLGRLARFGYHGDHGVPAWPSDYFACPTP